MEPDAAAALEVREVRLSPGLATVTFAARPGEVTALVGPPAATAALVRVALGLSAPGAGSVRVLGADAGTPAARSATGWVPGGDRAWARLSARETLETVAATHFLSPSQGRARARELLERVGLRDEAGSRAGALEPAARRRLAVAGALVNGPAVVLVEAPGGDADPTEVAVERALLREVVGAGAAVVVTATGAEDVAGFADVVVTVTVAAPAGAPDEEAPAASAEDAA